jgi:hypothetical protein
MSLNTKKRVVHSQAHCKFGDIIFKGPLYGVVIALPVGPSGRSELRIAGSDGKRLFNLPLTSIINNNNNLQIKRCDKLLPDFDKNKLLLMLHREFQKERLLPYGEYRVLSSAVFVQKILQDANILNYYQGDAFMLNNGQELYFGPPINYQTMNKLPNYLEAVKFDCFS